VWFFPSLYRQIFLGGSVAAAGVVFSRFLGRGLVSCEGVDFVLSET